MIVLSNSVDYQHSIWALQVVDKETKQVTVNPFKRLTKNIIEVNRTPIVQALGEVNELNLLWYTIFVIGYRLRSLRFVRWAETNEPYLLKSFQHTTPDISRVLFIV